MEDRIPWAGADDTFRCSLIGEVADDQLRPRQHRSPVPDSRVVEDDDLGPALQQGRDDMAADEPGSAGHKITRSRHEGVTLFAG